MAAGLDGSAETLLSVEALMQPDSCESCHSGHYREWASSMHAYSTQDPIFLAMEARGQELTGGELGPFCVQCHAPLAVALGLVQTGADLAELEDPSLGSVNCYFCHTVSGVPTSFANPLDLPANNPLILEEGTSVLRAGLKEAESAGAHEVAYSELLDGRELTSAAMCGACHDVVTPAGLHLERTFAEWEITPTADPQSNRAGQNTCNDCHMLARQAPAARVAERSLPIRTVHSHLFEGVDVALTTHPDQDIQKLAIQCAMRTAALINSLQVSPADGSLTIVAETPIGHGFPSGATQDRRAWLEITITDRAGNVRQIGHVPEGVPLVQALALEENARMVTYYDEMFDADDAPTHNFWEAASMTQRTLPAPGTAGGHTQVHRVPVFNPAAPEDTWPARIEVTMYVRPVGLDVVQDLLDSGHLQDEALLEAIPTFEVTGAHVYWDMTEHALWDEVRAPVPDGLRCPAQYRCELYPEECAEDEG